MRLVLLFVGVADAVANPFSTPSEACYPAWYKDDLDKTKCPHGYAGPGDVTIPIAFSNAWDNGNPFEAWDSCVFVFLGYAIYLLSFGAFILLCVHRGTRELARIVGMGAAVVGNEFLIKKWVEMPRPVGYTCLTSCGMPSSHSCLSLFMLTCSAFETFKWVTNNPVVLKKATKFQYWNCFGANNPITLTQLLFWVSTWGMFLILIPISRAMLGDHSWGQVAVGSSLGTVLGIGYASGCHMWQNKYHGQETVGFLANNYPSPAMSILKMSEDGAGPEQVLLNSKDTYGSFHSVD